MPTPTNISMRSVKMVQTISHVNAGDRTSKVMMRALTSHILLIVWGYENFVSSNIIEVYIRYLRIKLQAKGAKQLIHTVRSVGYMLRA
jgi:DNA-binding response OmpR family regulator